MGARKLTYSKEVSPKLKLIYRRDTANFSKNASKISLYYYPACPDNLGFGMLACPVHTGLPNRHGAGNEYRYGVNGMEKDDEIHNVEGSFYDFGVRIYDSRVGRWLSVDSLENKCPSFASYIFVSNSPLSYKDPNEELIIFVNGEVGDIPPNQNVPKNVVNLIGTHNLLVK